MTEREVIKDFHGRILGTITTDDKGNKVTREELNYLPRKCILCDRSYKECMYNSTHNVEDIVIAVHEIMDKFFNE